MKNYFFIAILLVFLGGLVSCKKDYISGGSTLSATTSLSMYDYLKGNAGHEFDTLLLIIDKAGLKNTINAPGITFFAPNDEAIFNYFNAKTITAQRSNPDAKYTLDSMFKYDLAAVADSFKMYIVNQVLTYDKLKDPGAKYATALAGNTVVVSYEYTTDVNLGYTEFVSGSPQIMYFTQLWKPLAEPFIASKIPNTIGVRTLCKTTGIKTSSGASVLNVLSNSHRLFFYGTQK